MHDPLGRRDDVERFSALLGMFSPFHPIACEISRGLGHPNSVHGVYEGQFPSDKKSLFTGVCKIALRELQWRMDRRVT